MRSALLIATPTGTEPPGGRVQVISPCAGERAVDGRWTASTMARASSAMLPRPRADEINAASVSGAGKRSWRSPSWPPKWGTDPGESSAKVADTPLKPVTSGQKESGRLDVDDQPSPSKLRERPDELAVIVSRR